MIDFKALSSETRIKMLKLLLKEEYHVSGLAKALKISVPVAAKHVKILEDAGLIEKKKFGKTQILRANRERLYEMMEAFGDYHEIEMHKGASILEALRKVAGIEVKKMNEKEYVVSVDGEEGFYIYEVDGYLPNVSMNEYKMEKDIEIKVKRIVPILKKRIKVSIKDEGDKEEEAVRRNV
ncbi:MAG: metalloregulator ArsR/SmtB family transcription factor [Candidatus Methanospirareceae archaeon]